MYNLTESQKNLLRWFVEQVRVDNLSEEFTILWMNDYVEIRGLKSSVPNSPSIEKGALTALSRNELLFCEVFYKTSAGGQSESARRCVLTGKAYEAVESNFNSPDTSFVKHLTPLADITNLDQQLKDRCLPMLSAGSTDPKLWDSAVRQAFLILEERLRSISGLPASEINTSESLVNRVFGGSSTLIADEKKKTSYRNLYSGVFTTFRNQYSHRFVDPSPEDGGAIITFVNLLLKMLEDLRPSSGNSNN
jgi:hypothetical protein